MIRALILLVIFFPASSILGCKTMTGSGSAPPRTVESVDLERYAGSWHEIARLPFRQQRGCHSTTATYNPMDDGRIEVINRCRDGSFDGRLREARAVAWPVDESNARLKVRFFWPFTAPYWILALDEAYQHALVGVPSRRYLWILSRTPEMPISAFREYVKMASREGYAVEELIVTPHEGVDLERYRLDGLGVPSKDRH